MTPISVTLTTSANLFGASLHVSEPFPTFVQGFSPESRETPTNPIYLLHALWYCNAQLPTLSVNYFLVETEALVHITFPLGAFVVEPSLHCISINKLPWSHKKKKKPCWKSWRIMVDWLVLIEEILPIKTRPPLAVVFLCVHPRWGEYKYSYFVWTGLLCVCRRTLLVPCPSLVFFLSRLRSEPVPAGCNSPGGCSAFVFVFCQDD